MRPLEHVERIGRTLDELGIPWVLGGSLAMSVLAEPRSTIDVDLAVQISSDSFDRFVEAVQSAGYYVPVESARAAVTDRSSFNLLPDSPGPKIDVFVLGDSLLDRRQIKRRRKVEVDVGRPLTVWIGSPEDQILRKLWWFDLGERSSERQWGDVTAIITTQRQQLDLDDLRSAASEVGLGELLDRALDEAG